MNFVLKNKLRLPRVLVKQRLLLAVAQSKQSLPLRSKILIAIFLLAVFLRFYKLAQFPIQLGHDEVSQLYDAISIAQTGKDIYGNPYPFIFKSVNDYKPPFYTYTTALSYAVFGWREVTVRIPGAIFGSLVVLGVYFFVNQFLKNRNTALFAALLTAISPFEVFYSRKSFENQAGVFLMLLGFTFLGKYLDNKREKNMYIGLIVLGLASYVYFAQAVLVPILILVFGVIFFRVGPQIKRVRPLIMPLALFSLLVAPLYYMIFVNPATRDRSANVFITQDARLAGANFLQVAKFAGARYIRQFDPRYLFLNGLDMTDGKRDVGPIFPVVAPFILVGVYLLARRKEKAVSLFVFAWALIGILPSGFTFNDFSPHRAIMAFTMLNIISAVGMTWAYKKFGKIALVVILFLLLANFGYFVKRYVVNFPIERSEALQYPYREVSLFAWENYNSYDRIVFDPKFGEFAPWIGTGAHYYLGFYGKYPPAKMQQEFEVGDQKRRETTFGKFSIRAVFWPEDHSLRRTLIIASPWSLPPLPEIERDARLVKTFYFRTTAPAFYAIALE